MEVICVTTRGYIVMHEEVVSSTLHMSESKVLLQQLQMRVTKLRCQVYLSISHKKALPTDQGTGLGNVIMKEANTDVEKVLEHKTTW